MLSWRAAVVFGVASLLGSKLTTCRSPGEGGAEPSPVKAEPVAATLKGVDTSALTAREKSEWSGYVNEFLAPCADQPVSLAQCVNEARPCKACVPAARYLIEQTRRGRVRAQVEASYRARFAPEAVKQLSLEGSPTKGPSNAPVVIAEWADFECPACASARTLVDELVKRYPNDVRVVFKHFPLSMHPNAEKAARAAVAAQRQGKFWELHGALFDNQDKLDPAKIEQLAKGVGLEMPRFAQDRDSESTADFVARDRKQGEALELKSTPSLFINGRLFPPTPDFAEELEEWVKLEIELAGGTRPASSPTPPAPSVGAGQAKRAATPAAASSSPAAPAGSAKVPATNTAPSGSARP